MCMSIFSSVLHHLFSEQHSVGVWEERTPIVDVKTVEFHPIYGWTYQMKGHFPTYLHPSLMSSNLEKVGPVQVEPKLALASRVLCVIDSAISGRMIVVRP